MRAALFDVDPQWREALEESYAALSPEYRDFVEKGSYIPRRCDIFNAFKTLPKSSLRYILFGQDPYPRAESATGYAFIDGAVEGIFSPTGLHKSVNRATSLRNFVKMALVAEGRLGEDDLSQEAVARVDRSDLIESVAELRENFESEGVLLLNAALLFEDKKSSRRHAKEWRPFMATLLRHIDKDTKLILFGSIAKEIERIPEAGKFEQITLEHPYNHTFVLNPKAHELFGPMHLLRKRV
ncbi:uracil-DNA glycosylase, family 1 [Hydrogenimonas sp.]|nr:uracil-DNA glycosylase, family 1 [Hydrogenimonas sp.]